MRWPTNAHDRRIVQAALAAPEVAARETSWRIDAGGRRVEGDPSRGHFDSIDWGFEEDGPACRLEASVAGLLPPSAIPLMTPVKLDIAIAGISTRVFTGRLLSPHYPGDGNTAINAATASYWLDKIRLMEVKTFANAEPSTVARNVLNRLPYTGKRDIANISGPKFNRAEDPEVFNQMASASDVLEALIDEIPLDFTDTPLDGCLVRRPVPLKRSGTPVATFTKGKDFDGETLSYEAALESEYAAVCAYRSSETLKGGIELLPGLSRVAIPGSRAPRDSVYPIEISDTSANYLKSAREAVYDAVEALSGKIWQLSVELLYLHPFLDRGDVVMIEEDGEDDDGPYFRRFKTRIAGLRGELPVRSTLITGTSLMTEQR